MEEELMFKMRQLAVQAALDEGIVVNLNQLELKEYEDFMLGKLIRAVFTLATQEETIAEIPATWFEHLKQTIYRKLKSKAIRKALERYLPVRIKWVVAYRKYPELTVPDSILGREFVHLRIVDPEKLVKEKGQEN